MEQHFHYHTTEAVEPASRTCIYNNVYIDAQYITKLRECYSAADLAKVVNRTGNRSLSRIIIQH